MVMAHVLCELMIIQLTLNRNNTNLLSIIQINRIVGRTGQILGEFDINIASMHLGRTNLGGNALMVLSIDHPVNQDVIDALFQIEGFNNVRSVELDIPQDTNYNI